MLTDKTLSLITVVRPLTTIIRLNILILVYYYSCMPSCYKTLALLGLILVNRKPSLTTIVRLNIIRHRCIIILVCLVVMTH